MAAKRQALLPVERAILHPNHRLPAVLQKGLLKSHRNGRVHFQGKKGSKSALAKCFVKKLFVQHIIQLLWENHQICVNSCNNDTILTTISFFPSRLNNALRVLRKQMQIFVSDVSAVLPPLLTYYKIAIHLTDHARQIFIPIKRMTW